MSYFIPHFNRQTVLFVFLDSSLAERLDARPPPEWQMGLVRLEESIKVVG